LKSGVLNVYKEQNMTSHDVVFRLRRILGTKKVGHAGTLDPGATGVLPVLVESATKACDLIPESDKTYVATVRFGMETDTEDVWGTLLREDEKRPEREAFCQAAESLLGPSQQIPPMMSAVKVNGKKLYEYLREGRLVERKPRPVYVYEMEVLSFSRDEATVRATVSKGTYIRTLLTDLCRKVGVIGAMSALERTKSGPFLVEGAKTLGELEDMSPEEREELILPTEALFMDYPAFPLPDFYDRLIQNGCSVLCEKLSLDLPVGTRLRLLKDSSFFALGEILSDEEGKKLKKIKEFF
jgi:tRNA pseudouridine55 synthase